jgi:hypothetical protein
MYIQLSVFERVILLNILPKQGSFNTLKILRELKEDLSFSEKENQALQFKTDAGKVEWQQEADKPKSLDFGETAIGIIKKELTDLDKKELLTEQHLSVYEKFINIK